jgi:hypothetical protein
MVYRLAYNQVSSTMVQINVINNATRINQLSVYNNLTSIYPNPSNGNIIISSATTMDEIRVTNMLGQVVYEAKAQPQKVNLQLDKAGIYFITTKVGKGVSTQKIMVQP